MSGKSTAKRRGRPPKKGRLALTTQQLYTRNLRQKEKEKEEKEADDEEAAAVAAEAAAVGTRGGVWRHLHICMQSESVMHVY